MSPRAHCHYDLSPPLPLPVPKQVLSRIEREDVDGSCWGDAIDSASSDCLLESLEGSPRLGFKLNHRQPDREFDGKAVPFTAEKATHFTAHRFGFWEACKRKIPKLSMHSGASLFSLYVSFGPIGDSYFQTNSRKRQEYFKELSFYGAHSLSKSLF